MTRKLSTALVVAIVLIMAMSVAVFAQGPTGDAPYAPQDGTGYRFAQTGSGGTESGQPGVGRTADGAGQGANFNDGDNDGICDNFVDEDGDGRCDTSETQDGQRMGRRNGGNQSNSAAGVGARRGGSRRNGIGPQAGGTLGGGHGRNR